MRLRRRSDVYYQILNLLLCVSISSRKDAENKKLRNTERSPMRCLGFFGLFLLICLCAYLFPQNKNSKKEASSKSRSTYGVKVNAVVINATVTDKSGNPVTDLTARDFKLYDDGTPQSIQTFVLESIDPPELEKAQIPSASTGASPQASRATCEKGES